MLLRCVRLPSVYTWIPSFLSGNINLVRLSNSIQKKEIENLVRILDGKEYDFKIFPIIISLSLSSAAQYNSHPKQQQLPSHIYRISTDVYKNNIFIYKFIILIN